MQHIITDWVCLAYVAKLGVTVCCQVASVPTVEASGFCIWTQESDQRLGPWAPSWGGVQFYTLLVHMANLLSTGITPGIWCLCWQWGTEHGEDLRQPYFCWILSGEKLQRDLLIKSQRDLLIAIVTIGLLIRIAEDWHNSMKWSNKVIGIFQIALKITIYNLKLKKKCIFKFSIPSYDLSDIVLVII